MVKHFNEAQWADFTRNVVAPKEKMDMQQHIRGGCQKCEGDDASLAKRRRDR